MRGAGPRHHCRGGAKRLKMQEETLVSGQRFLVLGRSLYICLSLSVSICLSVSPSLLLSSLSLSLSLGLCVHVCVCVCSLCHRFTFGLCLGCSSFACFSSSCAVNCFCLLCNVAGRPEMFSRIRVLLCIFS